MPQPTSKRLATTARVPRLAGPGASRRSARTGRLSAGSARFARTPAESPSGARFGRPASARKSSSTSRRDGLRFGGSTKKKSGGALSTLAGPLGGATKKPASGGGMAKTASGLAALAGLAGLAVKNRSKLISKLGRSRQHDAEAVTADTLAAPTTTTDTTPTV